MGIKDGYIIRLKTEAELNQDKIKEIHDAFAKFVANETAETIYAPIIQSRLKNLCSNPQTPPLDIKIGMFGYHNTHRGYSDPNYCPKNMQYDMHEYVNMGFNTVVMACKHCNKDKPKTRLNGELKIGKKYKRSDNGKEIQILAEKQGSGYLSEYEYFMLGSDGKMYKKDGEVTRYDEDTTWDTRNSKQPNDWFLTEG